MEIFVNSKPPPMGSYAPPAYPLEILHADAHLFAVEKPGGLLSVPGKDPAHADCLEARVRAVFPSALLVHRLDMDTSGVTVFALTRAAQRHLGLQFERRQARKTYLAEIAGSPGADAGEIDLPIVCDWPNRPLQKICHETGRAAVTRWEVEARREHSTLVRLYPRTGRSHQLRVHMRAMGHPILGDRFYGGPPAPRLMLHAQRLELRHPQGGAWIAFDCPMR